MTTLPSPNTREFPESSMEKKLYNIVNSLIEFIPIPNDRNRLGFGLYKFMMGEGDSPEILVKSTKIKIEGITPDELAKKLNTEIEKLK